MSSTLKLNPLTLTQELAARAAEQKGWGESSPPSSPVKAGTIVPVAGAIAPGKEKAPRPAKAGKEPPKPKSKLISSEMGLKIAEISALVDGLTAKDVKIILAAVAASHDLKVMAIDRPIGRVETSSEGKKKKTKDSEISEKAKPAVSTVKKHPEYLAAEKVRNGFVATLKKLEAGSDEFITVQNQLRDSEAVLKALKKSLQGKDLVGA